MMRNEYTGQTTSSDEEFAYAKELQEGLAEVDPEGLTQRVAVINEVLGRAWALRYVEEGFASIAEYAREKDFPETYTIACMYDELLKLALANPDDTWSGRSNEATRTRNDGARDVYKAVAHHLRAKLTSQHPANQAVAQ
jgi:hypothetical protein